MGWKGSHHHMLLRRCLIIVLRLYYVVNCIRRQRDIDQGTMRIGTCKIIRCLSSYHLRRTFVLFALCSMVTILLITHTLFNNIMVGKVNECLRAAMEKSSTTDSSVKHILLYTPFFDIMTWGLKMGSAVFEQCPVSNCRLTNNPDELG